MHGDAAFIAAFATTLGRDHLPKNVDLLLLPPACYLGTVVTRVTGLGVEVGAQNVHWRSEGAFTGEVAPGMVRELGAEWTLAGHSERRQWFGETDELVAEKFVAAAAAGLRPILCVGEDLAEREAGSAEAVVARQLGAVMARAGRDGMRRGCIAYEPVWAIGTGRTATPEQAADMHAFVRSRLAEVLGATAAAGTRILYGGSVTPENAAALFAQEEIDGALVGGASLDSERFLAIAEAAAAAAQR
jgi:triosephosphate isomerase (TIM)